MTSPPNREVNSLRIMAHVARHFSVADSTLGAIRPHIGVASSHPEVESLFFKEGENFKEHRSRKVTISS